MTVLKQQKTINLLIIDSFPIALLGYELCLKEIEEKFSFNIITATTIKEALEILKERTAIFFHTILLDVDLKSKKINYPQTGEDLAKRIKYNYPQTKIIALTEKKNSLRLSQITKDINPDAIIIKTEVEKEVFLSTIKNVLAQQKIYID